MREEFILRGKEIGLSNIVFLKKSKKKEITMDKKRITITFPRGKYGICRITSLDKVVTTLYLNPSTTPGSYGYRFDLVVKPEEVSLPKRSSKRY